MYIDEWRLIPRIGGARSQGCLQRWRFMTRLFHESVVNDEVCGPEIYLAYRSHCEPIYGIAEIYFIHVELTYIEII